MAKKHFSRYHAPFNYKNWASCMEDVSSSLYFALNDAYNGLREDFREGRKARGTIKILAGIGLSATIWFLCRRVIEDQLIASTRVIDPTSGSSEVIAYCKNTQKASFSFSNEKELCQKVVSAGVVNCAKGSEMYLLPPLPNSHILQGSVEFSELENGLKSIDCFVGLSKVGSVAMRRFFSEPDHLKFGSCLPSEKFQLSDPFERVCVFYERFV